MTDDLEAIAELGGAAAIEMVASALVDRGAHADKCPNCSAPVIGLYCAACGQPRNTHRRSVGRLLHEFISEIASFDSRILRTAYALVAKPGELSLAFREGRTQRYVPALRLYLFVSLIFFLVLSVSGIAILQLQLIDSIQTFKISRINGKVAITTNGISELDTDFTVDKSGNVYVAGDNGKRILLPEIQANGRPHHSLEPVIHFFAPENAYRGKAPADAQGILARVQQRIDAEAKKDTTASWWSGRIFATLKALATDPAAINGPLTVWIPRILFVLLPLFALFLAAFYWRQRKEFFFVDHLVFSLNIHSLTFVVILLLVGLSRLLPGGAVGWIAVLCIGGYLLLAMKRFYRQNWLWTGAKFAAISILYPLLVLLPACIGIVVLALLRI